MAVEIQELEVVPAAPSAEDTGAVAASSSPPSGAPHPHLVAEVQRAARLLRSRDLRLEAD
jgi:hypothetical protein